MVNKKLFEDIKNLLSQLTEEHKLLLKEGEILKRKLNKDLNDEIVLDLENFLEKVNKHAFIEENDLNKLIEKAGITEFDIEALNFGHRTLEEIEEYIKFLVDMYKSGKREYKGKSLDYHFQKLFNEYLNTLKDHFTEEEFYFFPDILKFSYVDEI